MFVISYYLEQSQNRTNELNIERGPHKKFSDRTSESLFIVLKFLIMNTY